MKNQRSAAPYGWASVCPPGRARNAGKKAVMRCGGESLGVAEAPPKTGWEFARMGKPGSRGYVRMMRSMARLRAKGATVST